MASGHRVPHQQAAHMAAPTEGQNIKNALANGEPSTHGTKRPWLVHLLARRAPKIAAVALANKMARMIWAMMMTGERYREPVVAAA